MILRKAKVYVSDCKLSEWLLALLLWLVIILGYCSLIIIMITFTTCILKSYDEDKINYYLHKSFVIILTTLEGSILFSTKEFFGALTVTSQWSSTERVHNPQCSCVL